MPKTPHFDAFYDAKFGTWFSAEKSFAHDFPLPRKCESSGIFSKEQQNFFWIFLLHFLLNFLVRKIKEWEFKKKKASVILYHIFINTLIKPKTLDHQSDSEHRKLDKPTMIFFCVFVQEKVLSVSKKIFSFFCMYFYYSISNPISQYAAALSDNCRCFLHNLRGILGVLFSGQSTENEQP